MSRDSSVSMTEIVCAEDDINLRVSTGLWPRLKKGAEDDASLCCYHASSLRDSKRKFKQITTRVSPHVTWLQCQYDRNCGGGRQKWGSCSYVSSMRNSNLHSSGQLVRLKIVSVFSSLKCEHALVKREKLPTNQSNICFLDEKQCVYRGRGVCWWNLLITTNEILDVSISFLNDHLEETLGSTKIEENHSKCINLTHVSVSF